MEINRRFWDEAVAVHVASDFYDVASFKAGRSTLLPVETAEVGDVTGKSLLHLQCHFGLDTLSWARAGARVTGVDFSREAVMTAGALASELGIEAPFVEANVYDLPSALDGQYDIVFTSYGVLCWLPDLAQWARIAARYVKPGGFFYIVEGHPMADSLADDATADGLRLAYPYFGDGGPVTFDEDAGTYANPNARLVNHRTSAYWHGLGSIVSSLIDAGLRIEFLHEFPFCAWARLPSMTRGGDGYFRLPGDDGRVPFLFSLRAQKS